MKKAICTVVLAFIMAFGAFGGASFPVNKAPMNAADEGSAVIETQDYAVWSAPSTVKIRREQTDYADKGPAELAFEAVKGEYESRQLMITAKSEIPSYELIPASLKNAEGEEIASQNIEIYNEFYTEVVTPTTADLRPGFYPDALIPIDLAKEAGELCIQADCNQGLWITIEIPRDVSAGTYTGDFILKIGADSHVIPVSVRVADYTLTEEMHTDTLFILRDVHLMASELDSTLEMKETYYDFFLDYRINLNNLPIDSLNAEEYVKTIEKYWADDRVTRYTIPSNVTGETSVVNIPLWKELYLAVVAASSPEKDLTSKLMFYFIDEPEGTTGVPAALTTLNGFHAMLAEMVEKIENDTTGKYDGFKEIDGWRDKILNTRNVATLEFGSEELLESVNIWCPSFYTVSKSTDREYAINKAEELGTELWWYGCGGPTYPYPTYHLDDNLLSSRVISWMQQAYGFTGQLYWSVASATDVYESAYYGEEVGSPFNFSRGDGYLVYPGARYGHYGPLPSLRLMSIRDGLEEYELLYDLQNKYEELSEEYGIDLNAKEAVNRIYQRIYNGMIPTTDIDVFASVRSDLIAALEETATPHGFLIGNISILENKADITLYVKDGYGIRIGEEELTKQDGCFRYTLDLRKSTYLNAEIYNIADETEVYAVSKFISGMTEVLYDFDDENALNAVTVTDGSFKEINSQAEYVTSGNSIYLEIASIFTGNEFTDSTFRPSFAVAVGADGNGYDLSSARTLNFDLFNAEETSFTIQVSLMSGNNVYVLDTITVPARGGAAGISLDLSSVHWTGLENVTAIRVQMTNAGSAENPVIYKMYLDNLFLEING